MRPTSLIGLHDKIFPAHQLASCVVDVCVARDVSVHRLMRGTGIFPEDLIHGRLLSAHQLLILLNNAQSLTPGHDGAFQIGRRLVNSHSDQVMQAVKHSRNLIDVLAVLKKYGVYMSPFIGATYYDDGETSYLALQQRFGCQKSVQFLIEIYCTALVALSQMLLGRRIPIEFRLPFKRPRYIQEYEENLGFRLHFDQPVLLMSFAKCDGMLAYQHHNDWAKRHALQQAQSLYPKVHTLLDRTRRHIEKSPNASLTDVANLLGFSPATFKRKLKEQGITFKQLHDDTRLNEAINCLLVKRLNNEQSAAQMAFNDLTNFRRSIKRWTGVTPNELRQTFMI